jgi:lipopolysaccharide/colanic/teichoic acid biosynthesis glycosyltransferase
MAADAEQDGVARWASENDSRITRFSVAKGGCLDELTQLFNILMSHLRFAEPRSERPAFVAQLAEKDTCHDVA